LVFFGRIPELVVLELVFGIEVLSLKHGLWQGYIDALVFLALNPVHMCNELLEQVVAISLCVHIVVRVIEVGGVG